MTALAGAPTRLNVRAFGSPLIRSGSVAVAVNPTGVPGAVVRVAGAPPSAGAVLTSPTRTVIGRSTVVGPSVSRTTNANVPGPWSSVGVHANAPVTGSMLAPAGAPTRPN